MFFLSTLLSHLPWKGQQKFPVQKKEEQRFTEFESNGLVLDALNLTKTSREA